MVRLANFTGNQEVDSINSLLDQVGLSDDLGTFLGSHLAEVLRKQQADVEVSSLEFIAAGACDANGQTIEDSIIALDSLSIPVRVRLTATSAGHICELDLLVTINATIVDGAYRLSTDVRIERQQSR
jgi:hypothetical protein